MLPQKHRKLGCCLRHQLATMQNCPNFEACFFVRRTSGSPVIDSTSASNVVPPLECCGCTRCKPQQHFFHFQISPQQHLKMDATSSQPGMSAPCSHHATLMIECGVGLAARRSHPSLGWVGMLSLRQHRSSQPGMTYATRFLIQNVINFKCTCLLCIAPTGCTIFCMGGMLDVG